MILKNSKFKDVRESVLYGQVRAKMDREYAAAGKDCRSILEELSDMLGERIKNDTEACGKVLEEDKTLLGAYEVMRETVRKRVKPERGKVTVGTMGHRVARGVVFGYFGIPEDWEERSEEKKERGGDSVKSVFEFL